MTTNPYQVLGSSIPPLLGRAALFRNIKQHLLKPQPDHVSVIGPKHYGKSVLLRHLAEAHRTGSGRYLTTAYIDLRNDTPMSDRTFLRRFAKGLKEVLATVRHDLSEYINLEHPEIYGELEDIFEDLNDTRVRVLVVFDHFDDVLAGAEYSRTLWSQLRELAQKASLRLVTGSRRPLRELCRTEESRTSNFWGIFYDPPVRVTALDDDDWPGFLRPLEDTGCALDQSARKEIVNWTGGVPVLVCALLRNLWDKHHGAHISKPEIDQAAETMLEEQGQLLPDLWAECDQALRSDLAKLGNADIPRADLSEGRRRAVEERGFGHVSGNRLRGSCRLVQRYAKAQAPTMDDLNRVFGTASGFETHIRSLLELRLTQVTRPDVDEDLRRFVGKAVHDLTPQPKDALTWVRSIAERALTLIWDAELPPDKTLPAEWLGEWRQADASFSDDRGKLPRGAGAQCNILRLVTGTRNTRRQSKYVTKATYLLVNHLQSVGDFGQHRSDFPEAKVSIGFAAAVVLTAISLVECLTGELEDADTV